ncbi:hypothetical protein [Pyxidicoccus fallax]|uniref:hypothetical protein n=1 Tax=Pyxidicoccus fallax TaxID=394095 RepID=UPI001FE8AB19|nr:hypothetical protein [Pyxidicoccus fallax]
MPAPSIVDILRHIAREEPLPSTVRAFRGLTREHLGQLIEEAAGRLEALAASPAEPRPEALAPDAAEDASSEEHAPASEGRPRKASKRTR